MGETNYNEIVKDISTYAAKLRKDIPDTMKGFGLMSKSASDDGALTEKTKELIATGIAVAIHCDGCIGFHVRTLVKLGTTRQEFEEVLGMAIYMGGGPALMYASKALRAWEEFGGAKE
ncbi:MAG: alkylhydroperoxidase [Rhodobacterales bacterium]|nr:MAG: alkylhydroperoxidase [Rhodobacterales bacterium]